jgi:3-methyladenine DNA glycosylase AlkD
MATMSGPVQYRPVDADAVLDRLRALARPGGREGMARFGINPDRALGVRIPDLRRLARELGRDHRLALALWRTGVHEARILASMVDQPDRVTRRQAERWVRDFDSWDLCDQVCGNLLEAQPWATEMAHRWAGRDEEFVKRAAFAVMAWRAVHARDAPDREFLDFLPVVEREAHDPRTYVKKATNWALRQIGKRNRRLHRAAIRTAERIGKQGSRPARWVAADALRELRGPKVLERLG